MADDLYITNASEEIETDADKHLRITNASEEIDYAQTISYLRMTNAAIMVEYKQTITYDRITNAAIMAEWLPPKFIALAAGIIAVLGLDITLDVPFHPHNYRNPMTKCLEIGAGGDNP